MSQVDAYTQIEGAIERRLRAAGLGVKRFLRPEQLPVDEGRLPASVLECGDEHIERMEGDPSGEVLETRQVEVSLFLIFDEGTEECRTASRAAADQARAALCDPTAFDVPWIVDVALGAVRPKRFVPASEKGSQAGFLLALLVTVQSLASTPWDLIPAR